MKAEQKKFLDEFESTLKARALASHTALMALLNEDPVWAIQIANAHEWAVNTRVNTMSKQIGQMEGLDEEAESELRLAAVELIKKIWTFS